MSHIDYKRFSDTLRTTRATRSLNQRQAAAQAGVSSPRLSQIETGNVGELNVSTFLRLCDWMEADPVNFIVADNGKMSVTHTQLIAGALRLHPGLEPQVGAAVALIVERLAGEGE